MYTNLIKNIRTNKIKRIDLNCFKNFYTTILDILPIFYGDNLCKSKMENEICCICEDKQADLMLECCVSKINLALFLPNLY
jgi:hypothetical protein